MELTPFHPQTRGETIQTPNSGILAPSRHSLSLPPLLLPLPIDIRRLSWPPPAPSPYVHTKFHYDSTGKYLVWEIYYMRFLCIHPTHLPTDKQQNSAPLSACMREHKLHIIWGGKSRSNLSILFFYFRQIPQILKKRSWLSYVSPFYFLSQPPKLVR
jgi:hypothetical protein